MARDFLYRCIIVNIKEYREKCRGYGSRDVPSDILYVLKIIYFVSGLSHDRFYFNPRSIRRRGGKGDMGYRLKKKHQFE